ncbi:endo-1,4-beta-xylanase [Pseudothermotoga sp. U03pept]|uniref:endo-1,4-beta-xylanase n=1 Tax=Pseudothermotoga sp. U03pept TaxID=3447012 RepID=UPI003F0800ED
MSQKFIYFLTIILLILSVLGGETKVFAQTISLNVNLEKYNDLIENRKIPVRITIINESGKPLSGVSVKCTQLSHEFYFGNAPEYLLFAYAPYSYRRGNRFGTRPLNESQLEEYKRLYIELFNYATVPAFYWADYEPVIDFIPLIEATNKIVQWLNENKIPVKGHTLVWGNPPGVGVPGWVVAKGAVGEWEDVLNLLYKRISREVNQFKGKIQMWDVVNEPVVQRWFDNLPEDYIGKAYRLVKEIDPAAELVLNEFGVLMNDETRHKFIDLARRLIEENVPVDVIGVEAHIFDARDLKAQLANLEGIYKALDEIAALGKPIHITEFQIPLTAVLEAFSVDLETAEKLQAEIAKIFYTVFFSHPAVEAIVYWNFYRAWQQGSGFLRDDLTVKPIYFVLKDLVHRQWKTSVNLRTDDQGEVNFKGFAGIYQVMVKHHGQETLFTITACRKKANDFAIVFNEGDDR